MTAWAWWDRAIPVALVVAAFLIGCRLGRALQRADSLLEQLRALMGRPAGQSAEDLHQPGMRSADWPTGEPSEVGAGESRAPLAPDTASVVPLRRPWMVTTLVHIWPDRDRIDHALIGGCICRPTREVATSEGSRQLVFTHHAFDGRRT